MIQLKDKDLLKNAALIGGQWIHGDEGRIITVRNPATQEVVGTVPYMGAAETSRAIDVAQHAFREWCQWSAKQRSEVLKRWYGLIMAAQEDLALIMTHEQGKPLAEARGEIVYGASFIEWFAEEARRLYGDVIPAPQANKRMLVIRQPIGVCAAITPWNFPNAMLSRKLAPALAAGCTMVVKPASQTPFSALAIAELAQRAGIPAGVINIVTGSASEIAEELTANPHVRKLTFTGSTEIGRKLMAQSAHTIKKLSLELGGNAPFIVFEDADIEAAIEGAMIAKFRNNGQTCVCANRFFVHHRIYDVFADKLAKRIAHLRVGNGLEPETQLGPMIDAKALEKVVTLIANAISCGAKQLMGGEHLHGNFLSPGVLTEVTPKMSIAVEEIFGPVAPLIRFHDDEEVIRMANDTEYGLAAYFYTRDLKRSWHIAEQLEYGMVGINTGLISTTEAPFGGIKQSGIGREGSKYGIDEYTELKYICMELV